MKNKTSSSHDDTGEKNIDKVSFNGSTNILRLNFVQKGARKVDMFHIS